MFILTITVYIALCYVWGMLFCVFSHKFLHSSQYLLVSINRILMKNLTRAYDCILSSVRLGVSFREVVRRLSTMPYLTRVM